MNLAPPPFVGLLRVDHHAQKLVRPAEVLIPTDRIRRSGRGEVGRSKPLRELSDRGTDGLDGLAHLVPVGPGSGRRLGERPKA